MLPYYIAGLPFAFYLLARWMGKESAWLEDANGLQAAYIALLWPLIAMGVLVWYGIDYLLKAIEMICKPFLKAYIWCNSWPHQTKKLERFGFHEAPPQTKED